MQSRRSRHASLVSSDNRHQTPDTRQPRQQVAMHSLMITVATAVLLLAGGIRAHFTVQHPGAIGQFNDDEEPNAPCGGYTPDLNSVPIVDFHVDGDFIVTTLTHAQGNWLYRINTAPTSGGNWTQVYPIFQQTGQGTFCNPHFTIPHEYIGKKAIFGFVSSAVDGLLYQCSGVRFVEGTVDPDGSCVNATNMKTSYTSDDALTSELGNVTNSSPDRVPNIGVPSKSGTFQGLGGLLSVAVMVVMGAALLA
ncbi:hypothetical protein GGR54DRAFT_468050 [Hypoxylon sp. NC1633]|nr:hypothetical protein GGR54DRAFT_468050 [Hypoxylon sp. NC1633]